MQKNKNAKGIIDSVSLVLHISEISMTHVISTSLLSLSYR